MIFFRTELTRNLPEARTEYAWAGKLRTRRGKRRRSLNTSTDKGLGGSWATCWAMASCGPSWAALFLPYPGIALALQGLFVPIRFLIPLPIQPPIILPKFQLQIQIPHAPCVLVSVENVSGLCLGSLREGSTDGNRDHDRGRCSWDEVRGHAVAEGHRCAEQLLGRQGALCQGFRHHQVGSIKDFMRRLYCRGIPLQVVV